METAQKAAKAITKMFSDNIDPETFDKLTSSTKILITIIKVFKFLLGLYMVEKINSWIIMFKPF
jgi:hypothetical protein